MLASHHVLEHVVQDLTALATLEEEDVLRVLHHLGLPPPERADDGCLLLIGHDPLLGIGLVLARPAPFAALPPCRRCPSLGAHGRPPRLGSHHDRTWPIKTSMIDKRLEQDRNDRAIPRRVHQHRSTIRALHRASGGLVVTQQVDRHVIVRPALWNPAEHQRPLARSSGLHSSTSTTRAPRASHRAGSGASKAVTRIVVVDIILSSCLHFAVQIRGASSPCGPPCDPSPSLAWEASDFLLCLGQRAS
jgi:hypothetical protein